MNTQETEFGGEFGNRADYKKTVCNRPREERVAALSFDWIIPFSYDTINFDIAGAEVPSNWLGWLVRDG